jgi:DNA-directed RNA polymerase subunit RPC12/RpoP
MCRYQGIRRLAVEEDEVGTQRALGHSDYVACSRCGRMTLAQTAEVVPGDAFEDRSEYQYLCSNCRKDLAAGEQDLAPLP